MCSPEPYHHSCQESASMLDLILPFLEMVDYNDMQSCRAMSQLAHGTMYVISCINNYLAMNHSPFQCSTVFLYN